MATTVEINEILSALMDGELSELEIHRFFRDLESLSESDYQGVMEIWKDFHMSQNILQNNEVASFDMDVSASVSRELLDEESYSKSANWKELVVKPLASLAVAASVTLVVVFGFQEMQLTTGAQPLTASTDNGAQGDIWLEEVLEVPVVASFDGSQEAVAGLQDSQKQLIDEKVKNYIQQHVQNVSLGGSANVVAKPRQLQNSGQIQ